MEKNEIESILSRIKSTIKVGTDLEMCKKLDIPYGTLDTWKNRNKIPLKRLYEIAKNISVDPDWLISGNNDTKSLSYDISLPYYPSKYVSAGGGAYPNLADDEPIRFSQSFLKAYLGLSNYSGMFLLDVTGDSMEPTLCDRSLIFVNPLENDNGHIKDGAIYVIQFDGVLLVKRVSYDPGRKKYMLLSDNKSYETIHIENKENNDIDFKLIGRVAATIERV